MYRAHTADLPVHTPHAMPYLPAARVPAEAVVEHPRVYQPAPLYSRDQVYELMRQLPAPPPAPVQPRDVWPARLLSGGAGVSMVLGTVSAVAPALMVAAKAVEIAGFGGGALFAGLALFKGNAPKLFVSISNNNTGSSANATSSSDAQAGAGFNNTVRR